MSQAAEPSTFSFQDSQLPEPEALTGCGERGGASFEVETTMFGFFTPRCPINLREQTWVELRMQWLVSRLGLDEVRATEVITPSEQHFPEPYSGTKADIERMFGQVCRWMKVPRESVELRTYAKEESPEFFEKHQGALGLYVAEGGTEGSPCIWIERSQAQAPMTLISTMAHELAHCVLLGQKWLTGDEADHEFITDLFPVVRGLGIFPANSAVYESNYSDGTITQWSVGKQGYMPARMFGYALALFAWLRGEPQPRWSRHLREDARTPLQRGLRYLQKTRHALLRPAGREVAFAEEHHAPLSQRLRSAIPGVRMAAFWQLRRPSRPELAAAEWDALVDCLDHSDPVLQSEAAYALTLYPRADAGVADKLLRVLDNCGDDNDVRIAMAVALGTQDGTAPDTAAELARLLGHASPRVQIAALTALRQQGRAVEAAAFPRVIQAFHQALVACNDAVAAHAVQTLNAICESPRTRIAQYFQGRDPDLQRMAKAAAGTPLMSNGAVTVHLPTPECLPAPLLWGSLQPQTTGETTGPLNAGGPALGRFCSGPAFQ